jgi:hypothetical protein
LRTREAAEILDIQMISSKIYSLGLNFTGVVVVVVVVVEEEVDVLVAKDVVEVGVVLAVVGDDELDESIAEDVEVC